MGYPRRSVPPALLALDNIAFEIESDIDGFIALRRFTPPDTPVIFLEIGYRRVSGGREALCHLCSCKTIGAG